MASTLIRPLTAKVVRSISRLVVRGPSRGGWGGIMSHPRNTPIWRPVDYELELEELLLSHK